MGKLNNVINACCGHGQTNEAYVQFIDGSIVRGEVVENIIKFLNEVSE
jgi:glutamine phosphoribosylpyrophosphate amidotransferase